MNNTIYGIVTAQGEHIDVARTLHGAKCHATHHGYRVVSARSNLGYNIDIVARKVNGKWVND